MYSIGIVGKGFVGSAVAHGFSQAVGYDADIKIYDKDPSKCTKHFRRSCHFICILFLFLYLRHLIRMVL